MIEGIESLYQQIAEAIQEAIPEEWTSAKMEAIFYSDSSDYFGEYTNQADGKQRSFATAMVARRAFRELRKKFKASGKPLWGRACFELEPSGKFNLRFGYEDCDENGDTPFDGEKWLKRQEERRKRLTAE